jgi:hypothetical protein
MPTQCSATGMAFGRAGGRELIAAFDGGCVTSEAGALLLGATDQAIGLVDRFAACFRDGRYPAFVTHRVRSLVGQRIFGLALGYEDVVDHDDLRHDPVLGALLGRFKQDDATPARLAGKSTLNRLEHAPADAPARYHKIGHDAAVFVDLFLDAFRAKPPRDIILDLDATDDPIHGHQEGRFFHGYYDCYCYLPLYIFCGRHLLAAKLRRSNIDASAGAVEEVQRIIGQIRACWPRVKIVLRADSGFAREALMLWCEQNRVDFVFGLARNARLETRIAAALQEARTMAEATGRPARVFRDFLWSTKESWSRRRRVIAKAEWTRDEANPRFLVTSLKPERWAARALYEDLYCARGEMENRIKECQGDLFADRTSAASMRANQLRLWFASMAYVLLCALRRIGLAHTALASATCGHVRHDPPQAPEDRRPRAHQCASCEGRHGFSLPRCRRVAARPCPPDHRRPRAAGLTGRAAGHSSGITLGPWRPTLTAPSIGSPRSPAWRAIMPW